VKDQESSEADHAVTLQPTDTTQNTKWQCKLTKEPTKAASRLKTSVHKEESYAPTIPRHLLEPAIPANALTTVQATKPPKAKDNTRKRAFF